MVDAGKVRPFHLSELSGALGTLEVVSGHRKNAAKLLEYSMTEPAENAIAQVAWIIRNVDSSVIKPIALITDRSSEASAWVARAAGDWNDAFDHAKQWQMEQPFSSRPALIASHAASTGLEDFDAAVEVLEQGLLCNPDDSSLLNNHAFAMAKQNRLIEARQSLARAVNLSASPDTRICLTATEGLIEFRSGNVELGRKLYRKAMSDAAERSDNGLGEVAQINLAIEEGLAHTAVATESIREAIENAKSLRSPYRETFLKKLARLTAPASL
jgi:tetratricopeptide (TPR) repeat protein